MSFADVGSIVARTWPTVTVSPGFTVIDFTMPVLTKFTGVLSDDSVLPLPLTEAVTVPRVTATVRTCWFWLPDVVNAMTASTSARTSSSASTMLTHSVLGRWASTHPIAPLAQPMARPRRDRTCEIASVGESSVTGEFTGHLGPGGGAATYGGPPPQPSCLLHRRESGRTYCEFDGNALCVPDVRPVGARERYRVKPRYRPGPVPHHRRPGRFPIVLDRSRNVVGFATQRRGIGTSPPW